MLRLLELVVGLGHLHSQEEDNSIILRDMTMSELVLVVIACLVGADRLHL